MVKFVINYDNRRGWIEVPEPPEKHIPFMRKCLAKWLGDRAYVVVRTLKFNYKVIPLGDGLDDYMGDIITPPVYPIDDLIRLAMEDYNQ